MLLEVEQVTKQFPGAPHPVFDGVSFGIEASERVGLVGPSGAGKSTLARIIARLERADAGQITFDGATLIAAERTSRAQQQHLRASWLGMQMVFQNPESSFSRHRNIGEAVWEGVAYHPGAVRSEKHQRVHEALREVGLDPSFAAHRPFELSGGECQRAAIARALISRPRLIICDEATSSLDVTVQAKIMDLLAELHRTHGMAFLFISHDLSLVNTFCDRVLSL